MKKEIFYAIATLLLWPLLLMASGLKVSPSELITAGNIGLPVKQVLTIQNPDTVTADFQVYSDDFSAAININPAVFTLKPQEAKVVTLEAVFSVPGVYKTNISVIAKPQAANKFRANTGVKISWEISIMEPKNNVLASLRGFLDKQISLGFLMLIGSLLIVFRLIWVILKKRRQPLSKG